MHRSKLPLTVWFWAAHLMATHSNGMSAVQLEAQLDITYKTAWLLAQKLRQAPRRHVFELWMLVAKELEETDSRPLAATATRVGTMGSG